MEWKDIDQGTHFTDRRNVYEHVYLPGFKHANEYIRDTGNFSSNVYRLMGGDLLNFLLKEEDNKMYLICSTEVRADDVEALFGTTSSPETAMKWLIQELNLYLTESSISSPVKMLLSLVSSNKLDLVVNLRNQGRHKHAITHAKMGMFVNKSTGEILSFQGSINETYPALEPILSEGNGESYVVGYIADLDKMAEPQEELWGPVFDRLQENAKISGPKTISPGTIAVPFFDLNRNDFPSMETEDWDPKTHQAEAAKRSGEAYARFEESISDETEIKSATEMVKDRPHQDEALCSWESEGCRGILQHATGSGKTITAIAAIEKHLGKEGNFVILVVPYQTLQKQWGNILNDEFGIRSFNIGGDRKSNIQDEVLSQISQGSFNSKYVLNTIQNTFTMDKMVDAITSGGAGQLNRALFVFDECHHVGRPRYSNYASRGITFEKVLGLSATPFAPEAEEEFDADNWLIQDNSFADSAATRNGQVRHLLGDVVHNFTLKQAMDLGYLTKYDYNIHVVEMTEEETNDYVAFREEIGKQMHWDNPTAVHQSRLLIKGISGKINAFANVIDDHYKPGQHWLVYCSHDGFLQQAKRVLREADHEWWEYTSHNSESRDTHMESFRTYGGIMLAVKCLDEGVDIPSITHGIILSSSTVEREFVQRRGRMLRGAEGKTKAVIYDAVTMPYIGTTDSEIIDSIMRHEIARIQHFEEDATNKGEIEIISNYISKTIGVMKN
jgi:superfamily II DNA or RNA helicase